MVRVSVVLPAYNEAEEVVSALDQIEMQSYSDKEVIVVDDGSTDGTLDAVLQWAKTRPYARATKTAHLGASHARNAGASEARGEIIFFAESDCTYSPDYLTLAVGKLDEEKGASGVCLTGAPKTTRSTLATECIVIENRLQHRLLNEGKMKPFYAWVFRTEAFRRVGGFDERLFQGEDKDLFLRFKSADLTIAWVPGVHWWHHRDQTSWDMATKWVSRGRSRVLFVLKHRMVMDMVRTISPLPAVLLALGLLFSYPIAGELLLLLVAFAVAAKSVRVAQLTWRDTKARWAFLGYPFFLLLRNFCTCIGYIMGIVSLPFRKAPLSL